MANQKKYSESTSEDIQEIIVQFAKEHNVSVREDEYGIIFGEWPDPIERSYRDADRIADLIDLMFEKCIELYKDKAGYYPDDLNLILSDKKLSERLLKSKVLECDYWDISRAVSNHSTDTDLDVLCRSRDVYFDIVSLILNIPVIDPYYNVLNYSYEPALDLHLLEKGFSKLFVYNLKRYVPGFFSSSQWDQSIELIDHLSKDSVKILEDACLRNKAFFYYFDTEKQQVLDHIATNFNFEHEHGYSVLENLGFDVQSNAGSVAYDYLKGRNIIPDDGKQLSKLYSYFRVSNTFFGCNIYANSLDPFFQPDYSCLYKIKELESDSTLSDDERFSRFISFGKESLKRKKSVYTTYLNNALIPLFKEGYGLSSVSSELLAQQLPCDVSICDTEELIKILLTHFCGDIKELDNFIIQYYKEANFSKHTINGDTTSNHERMLLYCEELIHAHKSKT